MPGIMLGEAKIGKHLCAMLGEILHSQHFHSFFLANIQHLNLE
jgi:hypothetical protein